MLGSDHIRLDPATLAGAALGLVSGVWLGLGPLFQALLVLMAADIATALIAAGMRGDIGSKALRDGILRKGIKLLLVLVIGWVGETTSLLVGANLPAGQALAGAFCLPELVSMLENARKAGVDIGPFARILAIARPDGSIADASATVQPVEVAPRTYPAIHKQCGRVAFLVLVPPTPHQDLQASECRHVDGRPMLPDAPIACDACGEALIGVQPDTLVPGQWVTLSGPATLGGGA